MLYRVRILYIFMKLRKSLNMALLAECSVQNGNSSRNLSRKHALFNQLHTHTHLLKGEGSGVASFPIHTSSIFVRTFLINAALLRTFSLVERLATVDNG